MLGQVIKGKWKVKTKSVTLANAFWKFANAGTNRKET